MESCSDQETIVEKKRQQDFEEEAFDRLQAKTKKGTMMKKPAAAMKKPAAAQAIKVQANGKKFGCPKCGATSEAAKPASSQATMV